MITERRKGQYSPCHLILHYSWNIFNSWSSQFANFFCTVLVNGAFRWTRAANRGSEALCCRCACVHFFSLRLQPSERCFHPVALGSLPWHSRRAPVPAPVPERTLSKVKRCCLAIDRSASLKLHKNTVGKTFGTAGNQLRIQHTPSL